MHEVNLVLLSPGAVAALIEQLPHIQDARANASESCPLSGGLVQPTSIASESCPLPSSSLKNGEASASQSCPR